MRFFIGYVLYKPDAEQIERINAVTGEHVFEKTLVFDNSDVSHEDALDDEIEYMTELKNDGLSTRYNRFLALAKEQGADYLCIMDQDSDYPVEEMRNMTEFLSTHDMSGVAIVAPRIYAQLNADKENAARSDSLTDVDDFVLNSGSFINMAEVAEHDLSYDENIFLDMNDREFCWAAKKKGLSIKIYENSLMWQLVGIVTERKGKKVMTRSPERYFYVMNGRKYLYQKYKGKFVGTMRSFFRTIGSIGKIILHDDHKFKKIKYCLRGQFSKKRRL